MYSLRMLTGEKIMTENKKRDLSLDIAKGICIILMVVGHAGCPEWMNKFM